MNRGDAPPMLQIPVIYDRTFAKPRTWILNASATGVRARFSLARREFVLDLELRCQRSREAAPVGAIAVFEQDDGSWLTEPIDVDQDIRGCELLLRAPTPTVAWALRQL